MENASKALLMAAGVLMTVLVLTLGLYLYASFSDSSQKMQDKISEANLDEFNNQFLAYTGADCTIYDILTLVNLANDYNTRSDYAVGDSYYIEIYVGTSKMNDILTNISIQDEINKVNTSTSQYAYLGTDSLGNSILKLYRYECSSVEYSSASGRVKKIEFRRKPQEP